MRLHIVYHDNSKLLACKADHNSDFHAVTLEKEDNKQASNASSTLTTFVVRAAHGSPASAGS